MPRNYLPALIVLFAAAMMTQAAYRVNKTTDTNDGVCDADCSLREAVSEAMNSSGARIVDFSPALSGTPIVLTLGEIVVNNVKIIGFGAKYVTISANGNSRIFYTTGATTIAGVTLKDGNGAGTQPGSSVEAGGGAIRTSGLLTLDGVHVYANGTSGLGGGVFCDGGSNVIRNSTFSANSAGSGLGSGIWFGAQGSTISNSTFSVGNNIGSGRATIVARNITAPVEIYLRDSLSTFSYGNSIIGHPYAANPTNSLAMSQGNNIIVNSLNTGPGIVGFQTSDQREVDPQLSALADYGGKVLTMSIGAGSPAVDAGSNSIANAGGLLYDQRRYTRVVDGNGDSSAIVDIGAYEYLGVPVANTSVSGTVLDQQGRAVRGQVTITDSQGVTKQVNTNPFGGYVFFDVAVGEVTVAVEAKSHRSNPVVAQALEGPGNTVNITVQ